MGYLSAAAFGTFDQPQALKSGGSVSIFLDVLPGTPRLPKTHGGTPCTAGVTLKSPLGCTWSLIPKCLVGIALKLMVFIVMPPPKLLVIYIHIYIYIYIYIHIYTYIYIHIYNIYIIIYI
jgi:hypothetical protein